MNREPAGVHDGTKLHNSYSIGLSDGTRFQLPEYTVIRLRRDAVRLRDCGACNVLAGTPCVTGDGKAYDSTFFVHTTRFQPLLMIYMRGVREFHSELRSSEMIDASMKKVHEALDHLVSRPRG